MEKTKRIDERRKMKGKGESHGRRRDRKERRK